MKSYREELSFNIPARVGFVNITPDVEKALKSSGIQEGLCLVNAMHITASVFINDDEAGLHQDYKVWLEISPPTSQSQHIYITEPLKTMQMRTSSDRSWEEMWLSQSLKDASTSAPGNRSFTVNSTDEGRSAYS